MKIIVLDGFRNNDQCADRIYKRIENAFLNDNELIRYKLCEKNIKPCTGCFGCWIRKPGKCLIEDDSQDIVKSMINSDIIIYYTAVIFGGYSYHLKKLLDKSICIISPMFTKINGEMHHRKRYDKYPGIIGMGVMESDQKEQGENFKELIYRNSLNMHSAFQCAEIVLKDDNDEIIDKKLIKLANEIEVER
ncbi:NAD(P)H-dependent oxidoreductase [Clostridium lundense]|uniref:NAD(P)H-dependent oxidoreductase n=1 Tax=Clostridium lundense TaxID=319475 RepID=UPI0004842FA4|nr:NAD(P)H-dependent oxidoreductase [Clostridium lundense]